MFVESAHITVGYGAAECTVVLNDECVSRAGVEHGTQPFADRKRKPVVGGQLQQPKVVWRVPSLGGLHDEPLRFEQEGLTLSWRNGEPGHGGRAYAVNASSLALVYEW